jgi:tripartite-type tricarboxylate transporter receptor subunit TctC
MNLLSGIRHLLHAGLLMGLSLGLSAHSQTASNWPQKPIRWIIPYTPGGLTDSVTRMTIQKLQENTGWTIVMENKPGANSLLGAEMVARSQPDGYTFLSVLAAHAANATLYAGRTSFDPVKSFAPVSLVGTTPLILTASNSFPAKDVKELIEYAKANPNKVSFGSSGIGAAAHLTSEFLKLQTGTHMWHRPCKTSWEIPSRFWWTRPCRSCHMCVQARSRRWACSRPSASPAPLRSPLWPSRAARHSSRPPG